MIKKGISSILANILLVLLAVVAITLIWNIYIPLIEENANSFSSENVDLRLIGEQGYTFYDSSKDILEVQINRGNDNEGEILFRLVATFEDGNSFTSGFLSAPKQNTRKIYSFGMKDYIEYGKPTSIKIHSISKRVALTGKVITDYDFEVTLKEGTSNFNYSEVSSFNNTLLEINSCQNLNIKGATYILSKNLQETEVSNTCMEINEDNIVLDCQGHSIIKKENSPFFGSAYGVLSKSSSKLTIKNCVISMNEDNGVGIKLSGRDSIIKNNSIYGQRQGIVLEGSNHLIQDNKVNSQKEQSGITLIGVVNSSVINNEATDNGAKGIELQKSSKYNLIEGNILKNNNENGCLQLKQGSDFNIIRNNFLEDCMTYGIWIWDSSNNLFENNYITNIQQGYSTFARAIFIRDSKAKNNEFYCNILENNKEQIVDWGTLNKYFSDQNLSLGVNINYYDCNKYCGWDKNKMICTFQNETNNNCTLVSRKIYNVSENKYLVELDLNFDEKCSKVNTLIISENYPLGWKILNSSVEGVWNSSSRLNESKIEWLLNDDFSELNIEDNILWYEILKTNDNFEFKGSWSTIDNEGIIGGNANA